MPTPAEIEAVCRKYAGENDYWVGLAIPDRKMRGIRSTCNIPAAEPVIALIDTTEFGSARNGLAVCASGIYWHNDSALHGGAYYLSWGQLRGVTIQAGDDQTVALGAGKCFDPAGRGPGQSRLLALLRDLQALAATVPPEEEAAPAAAGPVPPPPPPPVRWFLAINGQSRGPYDLSAIKATLRNRQLDPYACHVWTEGMDEWVHFTRVPSLAALIGPAPPPPPPKA